MRYVCISFIKYITNYIISNLPVYLLRYAWYKFVLGWSLNIDSHILRRQHIVIGGIRSSGKSVFIGPATRIEEGCLLYTTGGLFIGKNVHISADSWLITGFHDIDSDEPELQFKDMYKPIIIEDAVYIGEHVTILAGVTIGEGATVNPGSVVARNVPAHSIVEGVPAKVI